MTNRLSQRLVLRDEVQGIFHEYWQIYTALKMYHEILELSPRLQGEDRLIVGEMAKILEELEKRSEAVRARVLALIG